MVAKLKTPVISRFHISFVAVAFLATLLLTIVQARQVSAAACPAPAADYGTVTTSVTVASVDTYRIWARMKVTDDINDYFHLEIDGNTCFNVGGGNAIPANAWTWIPYADGQVTTAMTHTFSTTGSHTVKLIGAKPDVQVDRLIFTADTACRPTGMGDDCMTVTPPPDTTPPVISAITSSGITQTGATISWTTDENSDTQVEYGTTTSYGSSTTLNTTDVMSHSASITGLTANTLYHYRVKSRDAANNLATSTDRTFTTSAVPDTTPPTISAITSSGITQTGATISWTTANETSTTQVEYGTTTSYGTSTTLNTSLTNAHTVTLSGLTANTTYHYRVKSRDAAGNTATSADQVFTTLANTTTKIGDLFPFPPNGVPDGVVDVNDLGRFASTYGKSLGQAGYIPEADVFNPKNNTIDVNDLGVFAANYGK